ncbi:MAG: Alpha/Beta hydrolase protein [Olpidium bornovanus]|uniref:Alpha/Beta hydrolase protein n=1 Tax=Olpidium bornovanus TaxID=278681 RepID=A0A8H7ZP18_9FUNG|nr:MAG: Alpha/Beta hydrolase protein [Olpidium bornovanus]
MAAPLVAPPLLAGAAVSFFFFLLSSLLAAVAPAAALRGAAGGNDTAPPPLLADDVAAQLDLSARYAAATYCLPGRVKRWKCGRRCPGKLDVRRYLDTRGTTGVVGYVGLDAELNRIVVAFRGSLDYRNWVWDLQFAKIDYHYPPDEMDGPSAEAPGRRRRAERDAPDGPMIHSGFWISYRAVRAATNKAVEGLLREMYCSPPASRRPRPPSILVTGHSLGAALATFAALDFKAYQTPGWTGGVRCGGGGRAGTRRAAQRAFAAARPPHARLEPPAITLHQFGGPRVGNRAFAELVRRALVAAGARGRESRRRRRPDRAVRVVNRNDWVPHLPPAELAFAHHPHEVWIGYNDTPAPPPTPTPPPAAAAAGPGPRGLLPPVILPPGTRVPHPAYNCTGDLSPPDFPEDPRCSAKVPWWDWSLAAHGVVWGHGITVFC